jgi:preprotein translocase subunit SecB
MVENEEATQATETKDDNNISMSFNAHFVRELSFLNSSKDVEVDNKAKDEQGNPVRPKIDISLNIKQEALKDDIYEVSLQVAATSKYQEQELYKANLNYVGIFTAKGLGQLNDADKEKILLTYCPTLIYPYARRVVAELVRDGGFSPLELTPVDFNQLYQQRSMQKQQESATNPSNTKH